MPLITSLAFAWAVQAAPAPYFPAETDPGGCRLERIVGADGESHVQFRGLSPDGRRLAVSRERVTGEVTERQTYILDLVTLERRPLPGLNGAAAFSPDGKRVVAANYPPPRELKTEIVELELATGKLRSLAPHEAMEWLASYSHDGRWVVFNSFRTGASDLYRVRTDTGVIEQLTDDPRYEAHAQISRDGRRILFHRQIAGSDYGLALLDVESGAVTEFPGTGGEEAYPAWSPDERWISYSADAGQTAGLGDIYVMPADGGTPRRLTAHPAKDAYSTWSPDGRYIYFNSARDFGTAIYRLEVTAGDCVRS